MLEEYRDCPLVWCTILRTYAYLIESGAYATIVYVDKEGNEQEDQIGNDEYEYWIDHAFNFESDDE